jgi:PAS domain S-box-containing protein
MELTCEEVVYSLLLVPVRDLGYLNIYGRDITERKRVEVELRESQSRLDLALRSAQMGVWRLDLIEDKRFFDDQVCRLLGIDPAKFTGTAEEFYKAVHPVDREALKAALARNIEQNLQYETEYRAVWPDGSVHYVTSRGKLVHDDKGRPVRVNGLIWDISERKRAEETLQTTVQRFHKILSNIFVGILVVTEDDQIEFANQDFCDQFDIAEPPSELIGLTAKEMLQKVLPAYADPEAYSARIKQILSQRRRIEDEEVLMRDGRVLLRDHIPILVDGKPHGRMWQHRDITERKRTEDELRESQQKNEFLADIIRIGSQPFVVGYPDGHLGLVNSAFEHLTGYSSDELQSIDWAIDLTPPEWLAIERQKLEEQLRTGKPIRYEKEYIRKDGSRAPIELLVHLVTDSDGMPQYYYSFLTDISERKRMEEELRESEAKYRTLFENMAEEVHFWRVVRDEAGLVKTWRLVDANPPTLDTWGRSSLDEIREKTTDEIFGPGAADHYMPVVQKIMTEGVPHSFEDYFPNLDKYFRFTSVPLGDYFITTGADITSIKKAEQVLRKAHDELEARVRERTAELVIANEDLQKQAALLNLSHDAIFVVDSAGVVSFWNSGAEDLYGFTREQAVENVAYEFLHTRFPESLAQVVSQVIDKGQWAGELRQTTSGGKELVVESRWALRRGDDGEPTGFLEVNRDITSRKIVEERLRRADRAFRTLSECNQAIVRQAEEMELLRQICRIVVEDGGYRMAWVGFAENDDNKTVRPVAYAGYDHGYLDEAKITWADVETGRGPTGTAIRTGEISISKDALSNPAFAPWRSEAAKRGFASSIAFPLIVDGQAVGALTIYAPEPDAFDEREVSFLSNLAENLAYGIASIRVAIQRRRSEEDLRVYAHRLEVINKELEDFAFIASHDLQEPLRKIQTFCDMAVKRCATVLDSTSQDYLERVVNSASRMRQLLSDLLMFSRVASRPEPFKRIDLSKIAREAADVFEAAIKETGAQVEIETMPGIEADGNQILRLFQNLIGNALKFRGADKPRIMVYAKQDRTGVCEIFVKDNGIGFDPQFAELIFKPFQRLHRRNEYEGTGMGLAICRKIVERHGGNISAGSEPGRGSTFVVRLPVKQDRWEGM